MENRLESGNHNFISNELVPVEEQVKMHIETAILMIWNKHVGKPTAFNIVYTSRIIDPNTGQTDYLSSEYDSNNDVFKFAFDTIPERIKIEIPLPETCFILAAHEATHKVQVYRGDKPKASSINTSSYHKDYFDDKQEEEAWREALDAFKKVFPEASGGITIENRKYEIPDISSY